MWPGPEHPYQDLPALPPAEQIETPAVLKAVIPASRKLAALDQACKRLPDPSILINILPVLEAQASSEIENIVTTNDELFRATATLSEDAGPAVKEALRYRQALSAGYDHLTHQPITTATALEVCSVLQGRPAHIRNQPGTFIGNPVTRERIYTPPEGVDVLRDHLSAWERFLHTDHGLDPLIVMALQHYQFEAIHPFFDGNGRTGRVLNLLVLIENGLIELPVLYLSGHIVRHKDEYYSALRAVTIAEDWDRWIRFMIEAVDSTSRWTLDLVEGIEQLRQEVETEMRLHLPAHVPVSDLTRALFTQPYLRIDTVVTLGLAQRQTASKWLAALVKQGILERQDVGRGAIFLNIRLLNFLTTATQR